MNARLLAGQRLAIAAMIVAVAGCTAPSGRAAQAPAPAVTATTVTPQPQALTCRPAKIKSAVRYFFAAWNHRDRAAFGRLFDPDGAFALAGQHQDTLSHGSNGGYTEVGGRGAITALAQRQWALGERLSYHGMTIYVGYGGGAEVNHVSASFPGPLTQPIEEAKFIYDCATGAFAHVVIISAGVAR